MIDRQPFAQPDPQKSERTSASGFSMIALHSADRMTRSLSPWTRQMLGDDGGIGVVRHTSINRILTRRTQGSFSFPSTLAILRRFHRIVTRSSAWKADVGSVDPNLFERFASDLTQSKTIGANNINALISLGEQRRREMEMPLAGAPGEVAASGSVAAPGSKPPGQNPFVEDGKPLTMDDIRQRILDARRYKSGTPGSQPDFVRAEKGNANPPAQAPAPENPGQPKPPVLGQRSPFPQPNMPSPPSPSTPPGDNNAERQVPPRLRRRRFASVEYVSMPNMDDDEDGGSKDDADPPLPIRFGTGPPGALLDELIHLSDTFAGDSDSLPGMQRVQRSRAAHRRPSAVRPSAQRVPGPDGQRPEWVRRRGRRASARSIGRGVTIGDRPMARLADSLSGRMLSSRPHQLLAQVLRKEQPPQAAQGSAVDQTTWPKSRSTVGTGSAGIPDHDALAAVEYGATGKQTFAGHVDAPRLRVEGSRPLPISPDDFALPYLARLRARRNLREDTDESTPVNLEAPSMAVPMAPAPGQGVRPLVAPRRVLPTSAISSSSVAPRVQAILRTDSASSGRRPGNHRRLPNAVEPLRRETVLAQLQASPLFPMPLPRRSPLMPVTAHPRSMPAQMAAEEQAEDQMDVRRRPALPRLAAVPSLVSTAPRVPGAYRRSVTPAPSGGIDPQPPRQDQIAARMIQATSRQVDAHTRVAASASPVYRALAHLSGSLSGRLLASRPQTLMGQVLQRKSTRPQMSVAQSQPEDGQRLSDQPSPPALGLDAVRWPLALPAVGPVVQSTPDLLPISAGDFVFSRLPLAPVTRVAAGEDGHVELPHDAAPAQRTQSVRGDDDRRVGPAFQQQVLAEKPEKRAVMRSVVAPRPAPSAAPPRHRRTYRVASPPPHEAASPRGALAQLQLASPARIATSMRRLAPVGNGTAGSVSAPDRFSAPESGVEIEARYQSILQFGVAQSPMPSFLARQVSEFEPISTLWRREQIQASARPQPAQARLLEAQMAPAQQDRQGQRSPERGQAQLMPLAVRLSRLLGKSSTEVIPAPAPQVVGNVTPLVDKRAPTQRVAVDQLVGQLEQSGWRFKRTGRPTRSKPAEVQRSVESLGSGQSRPLAKPVRTLMERVLGRDFASVRVQTASLGALGVEAATAGGTVYLSPETVRMQHPRSLGVLAHELTHVAARDRRSRPSVQRRPLSQPAQRMPQTEQSLPLPSLSPHLTRQLSQQLTRLSLVQEEHTAEQVERAVETLAPSVYGARRFAPVSQTWQAPSPQRARDVAGAQTSSPPQPVPTPSSVDQPAVGAARATGAALLQPGWRPSEPGASSALVQRQHGSLANVQSPLPLTNMVLARLRLQQEIRTSQPPLSAATASPASHGPVASVPPAPMAPMRPSVPSAVQRRIQPPPSSQAVVRGQRQQAIQRLGHHRERYHRFEPSSALWRSALLAAPVPGNAESRVSASVTPPLPAQRRLHWLGDTVSAMNADAKLLRPGDLSRETLSQSSLLQPARTRLAETGPSPAQMPLAPVAHPSSPSSPVRRAAVQIAEPATIAATVAQLPQIRRMEQSVQLQVDRSPSSLPVSKPVQEGRQQSAPSSAPQPAYRTARLVRRRTGATSGQSTLRQSTLLERVVARDFTSARPTPLASGSSQPDSNLYRQTMPARAGGGSAQVEPLKPFAQEIIQRSVEARSQPRAAQRNRSRRSWTPPGQPLTDQVLRRDFAGVRASLMAVPVSERTAMSPLSLATQTASQARMERPGVLAEAVPRLPLAMAGVNDTSVREHGAEPLLLAQRKRPVSTGSEIPVSAMSDAPVQRYTTRQMSQQLVQMSLAPKNQPTIEQVEQSMTSLATAAHVARRFAPVSHVWRAPYVEERAQRAEMASPAIPDLYSISAWDHDDSNRGQHSPPGLPPLDLPVRPESLPPTQPVHTAESGPLVVPTTVSQAVSSLQTQGWRFKRAKTPRLISPDRVQRAVAQLQRSADQGMPLPRQPRTLMERVLQRDFSRVRLQTAPVQSVGVEAAARDNTVFLSREQVGGLDRPENLALLGHELTHVAASGNAPVRRSVTATGGGATQSAPSGQATRLQEALPLRPLLPATIQRSLAGEERVATQVEEGLRTFLRQSAESQSDSAAVGDPIQRQSVQGSPLPVAQRQALAAHSGNGNSSRPQRIQRATVVGPDGEGASALPLTPAQLKGFRGGEPTLSGIPQISMNLAPKTPIVRRAPTQESTVSGSNATDSDRGISDSVLSSLLSAQALSSTNESTLQRAEDGDSQSSSSRTQPGSSRPNGSQPNSSQSNDLASSAPSSSSFSSMSGEDEADEPADWKQLADKIYPLIKRMLMRERERMPR